MASSAAARPDTTVKSTFIRKESPNANRKSHLIVPYIFATESMGVTVGLGGGVKGYIQDQLLMGATTFASSDEATGVYMGVWDYQPSFVKRLFFSFQGMAGHYPRERAYSALRFQPGAIRPGSNESSKDQFVQNSGYDNWTDFKFEYVLPIGSARHDPLQHYVIERGLLKSQPVGGPSWNPLKYGVTNLLFMQYNRYRSFEMPQGKVSATIHPFRLELSYNNTDFPNNPSTGSSQYIAITQDMGWLESPDTWTFIELEASKYFSLGSSPWARQRIIALNLWTGDCPTWDEELQADGRIGVHHRPPFYEGATLGGFYRMRGYPVDRFNDRSVIYTAAEYRYTLDWNPLGNISWLAFLQSDWLQLVGFVEGGRVANDYGDLYKNWQVDYGAGLRAMFTGAVFRLDVGASDETTTAWAMISHPF